jgi:hypothetical protein
MLILLLLNNKRLSPTSKKTLFLDSGGRMHNKNIKIDEGSETEFAGLLAILLVLLLGVLVGLYIGLSVCGMGA